MCTRWFAFCLVGLCCVQLSRADTIVLRNGEHLEGQIVGETANDVSIRRAFKNSNIRYVDKIARGDIVRIERSATQPAEEPAPATAQPAVPEAPLPSTKIADKPGFLEGAIHKFVKPDYQGAGMDLSRLIVNSTPEEREQLSAIVQDKLETSLAELAAIAHFQAAMERAKGRAVQFQYVTEYEKPALIPMIREAYEKAIDADLSFPGGDDDRGDRNPGREGPRARASDGAGSPDGPAAGTDDRRGRRSRDDRRRSRAEPRASRRGSRERDAEENDQRREDSDKAGDGADQPTSRPAMTIRAWMDDPRNFDGNRRESLAMSVQIYHAKSLLGEQMRLDPQVKTDVDLKAELAVARGKLDALLKAVKARAGGALTPQERENQEAEYRNRIDAAQRAEWRRHQEAWSDLRRLMEEQERQRQYGPGPNQAVPAPTEPGDTRGR